MKLLIIGLGNPILGDDGVGWVVARQAEAILGQADYSDNSIEVDCLALGGISLMERMAGYQAVILIDSLNTGQKPQGSVTSFSLDILPDLTYGHSAAAHDASLKTSLDVGRRLNIPLPADQDIHLVAIEASRVYDFSEALSAEIAAAVPVAVDVVLDLVNHIQNT